MTDPAPASPWTRPQLQIVLGANGAALVLLTVAWERSGGTATLDGQLPWLNVAVVALVVSMAAHGALVFVGRRAIGRRRQRLLPDRVTLAGGLPTPVAGDGTWLWVPGTRRAHRPGCPLVAGKPATAADEDLVLRHALQRCEVCG